MERLHIHVVNYRKEEIIYQATESQIKDALERHSDLSDRVKFTVSSVEKYFPEDWTDGDRDNYLKLAQGADVLYGYTFLTEGAREYAPNLKWIQSASSGVEQLAPFDWIPKNALLTNSRGVHQERSGESFAMYLGMLNAKIPEIFSNQCKSKWEAIYTSVAEGKTLAVVGLGAQGTEMARQAKLLGMKVIGFDPYVKENPYCDEIAPVSDMKEVFGKSDFMAVCAPLTEETDGMIDDEKLAWLPNHAGVINVARAKIMSETALSRALRGGKLSGAVLDDFEEFPLSPQSPLWTTPNLFISPHVSSDDPIRYTPLCLDILMRNVRNFFDKKPLENVIDMNRGF